jgi:acylglycerol lipase
MNHTEGDFKSIRNLKVYYQAWLPEGIAKAVLLVVHGLGEHSGRYMNVVNHFVPLGYAVYALDHIGHGRSDGGREIVERFTDYIDPLATFQGMVKGWQPDSPVFLLGHSMGGLIVSYYLLERQDGFRGAVISAPGIKIGGNVPPLVVAMGKLLSVVAPKTGVVKLDTAAISQDAAVVRAYEEDPLVFHGKTPARLAAEMLRTARHVSDEAGRIRLPVIIAQGTGDRLVDPSGAQLLYDTIGSTDKTIRTYDGFYHEIFNEPERKRVLKDVETWLAARV